MALSHTLNSRDNVTDLTAYNRVIVTASIVALLLTALCLTYKLSFPLSAVDMQILYQLRLPTVLTAILVGAGLSVSAASLQVLLRNPLADPGIIGITSGASLVAAIVLLLAGESFAHRLPYLLPIACFCGAMASAVVVYALAKRLSAGSLGVILAGIAISTLCGAAIAWMHLISDAQSMRNLTFWLMGSLHQSELNIALIGTFVMLPCLIYIARSARDLNQYYMGESVATLAGLDTKKFDKKVLLICALMVAISVSIAGAIAFVGLLVPHTLRQWLGNDNRLIVPLSGIVGATLMLCIVLLSHASGGMPLPVSMLTATLGGPVLLYALVRNLR